MYKFLSLSFLSGVIELGCVFLGIYYDFPIHKIILLPFFYQIGNLLMNALPKKNISGVIISTIAIIFSIVNYLHPIFLFLCVQIVCVSYCIQLARIQYKSICPTWLKRSFRIGGFVFSPLMTIFNGQLMLILSLLFCTYLFFSHVNIKQHTNKNKQITKIKNGNISTVMIFHQLHYFVYTYIMPVYVYQLTNSIVLSALLFSITWVTYLLPQTIAEKYNISNYRIMFFACHIFLCVCMITISISTYQNNHVIALIAWFLTGIGGGSVFCISHLCNKYKSIDMELSENIGHFFGPLVAIIICYFISGNPIVYLAAISAIFIFIALFVSLYIIRKEM